MIQVNKPHVLAELQVVCKLLAENLFTCRLDVYYTNSEHCKISAFPGCCKFETHCWFSSEFCSRSATMLLQLTSATLILSIRLDNSLQPLQLDSRTGGVHKQLCYCTDQDCMCASNPKLKLCRRIVRPSKLAKQAGLGVLERNSLTACMSHYSWQLFMHTRQPQRITTAQPDNN